MPSIVSRLYRGFRQNPAVWAILPVLLLSSFWGCGKGEQEQGSSLTSETAISLLRDGQVDAGLEELQRYCEATGDHPAPDRIPEWLKPAVESLVRQRALNFADSLLSSLGPVESRPDPYKYLTANISVLAGHESRALEIYRMIQGDEDLLAKIRFEEASLHQLRERHEKTIEVAREGLALRNNDALRMVLAGSLSALERHDEALVEARAITASTSQMTLEGDILLAQGHPDSALEVLSRAQQITPNKLQIQYLMGRSLVETGDFSGAAGFLEPLVQGPEPYRNSQLHLAEAWRGMGKKASADSIQAIYDERTVRMKVNDLRVRGLQFSREGELEEALGAFREAAALSPERGALHNDIGVILARKGDYEHAEASFLEAAKLDPRDPAAQRNLARLYHIQGDSLRRDEAIQRYEDLLPPEGN